jgi:hypothetical protein
MEDVAAWWSSQKRWWKKRNAKTKAAFESFFDGLPKMPTVFGAATSSSGTGATDASGASGVLGVSTSPLKNLFGVGYGVASETTSADVPAERLPVVLNKTDLAAALTVYFPETAVVVLCREDGRICTSENYPAGALAVDELKTLVRAVNVEDRDAAIAAGLQFAGKRFEVFQFHPPLVYGRTAGGKDAVKDSWGIAVVKHEVGGDHACIFQGEEGDGGEEVEEVDEVDEVEVGDGRVAQGAVEVRGVDEMGEEGDGPGERSGGGSGGGRTAYLTIAYPLPNTSAYILSQAQAFCMKFL